MYDFLGQSDAGAPRFETCHVLVRPTDAAPPIIDERGSRVWVTVTWEWMGSAWSAPRISNPSWHPFPASPCGDPDCAPPYVYQQLYAGVDRGGEYVEWRIYEYRYNYAARGRCEGDACVVCE